MNTVNLIGRLTRDPETRQTGTGKQVVNFTLAVNKGGRDDGAYFFDCVAWEKTGDFVAKYLSKGRLVGVTGHLSQRKWQDKDGNNRTTVEVVAGNVQGLDRPKDDAPAPAPSSVDPNDEYDPFSDN